LEQLRAECVRLRAEAAEDRKAVAADRERAEYQYGQAEHRLATVAQMERSIAARERWLEQHDEAKVRALVAAADKALADAKALKADYDAAKHSAARALVEINEREKAEREAA
jgi:peroxiredoxin